ncbi:MAG: MBL fold metallo-hydrolase [Anaerolineae bacterium]|nr:MBL fold metallo-hydrolase [Anaerolineae bacterium]
MFTQWTPYLWVAQSALYATNHGVFIAGDRACLIDPGLTRETLATITAFVAEREATPHALVITHGHWDHILGPEVFANPETNPSLHIVAHARYLETLKNHGENLQQQITNWETESDIHREHPFVLPRPTLTFTDMLHMRLGDQDLQMLFAPGHAPDQLVVYHAATGMLWAGDMLSDVEIPMASGGLVAYEDSLARLAELDVQVLIPGHGAPTADLAEIRTRFAQDRAYLAELHKRVTHAVQTGMTREETLTHCATIARADLADCAEPHRWNVESAYVELGGAPDGDAGWEQEWQQ